MLDKRHVLGGLQVGGPRTAQNPARFRVANNVYQTRDDVMVPRFHNEHEKTMDSSEVDIVSLAEYQNEPFIISKNALSGKFQCFKYPNGWAVPALNMTPADFSAYGESDTFGPQSIEKFGCLYIHIPYYGLHKYDGTQFYRAGVPLPYFSSAQRADTGAAYIRVIQHHIDFQGNIVNSGYVQFRATPSSNIVNIRHDGQSLDIIGNTGVTPNIRTSRLGDGYDEIAFIATGTGVVDTGNKTVTIPTSQENVMLDGYVVITATLTTSLVSGLPEDSLAIAMRVDSFDSSSVTLSMFSVKYLNVYGEWNSATMSNATTLFATTRNGGNHWCSVWASNTETGNYVYRDLFQVQYIATTSKTHAVDCSSLTSPAAGSDKTAFNLAGNLGDIYDVTTVKDVFPIGGAYSPTLYPISFTAFGELGVIADQATVFFSDSSLGGSFEMINGLSFAVVGEGNDGRIQAVCANSDFLLVSRQNRNYYVAGALPTGNYRVQGIPQTSLGCYSNESCISVEDKIIFFNSHGVWALYAGARCVELSENIRGLFPNASNTYVYPEENFFDISGFNTFGAWASFPNRWVRARYDNVRNLLAFLISGDGSGTALVLNMNNGEFYTWNGLDENSRIKDILFIDGEYYFGTGEDEPGDYPGWLRKEVKTGADKFGYAASYPIRLDPTWFTAGEPSWEKKLNQLKLFGTITSSIELSHYLDWRGGTEILDGNYTNTDEELFSHKKRFHPANFLSVSPSLKITPGEGRFELEGIEIEFQPFQEGMKR